MPATATSLFLNSSADITNAANTYNTALGDFITLGAEDDDGVLETMRVNCYATGGASEGYVVSDPHAFLRQEFANDEGNSYTIRTGGNWEYDGSVSAGGGVSYLYVDTVLNMKEVDYRSLVDLKTPLNKTFYLNVIGRV